MLNRRRKSRRLIAETLEDRRLLTTNFPLAIGAGEGLDITADGNGNVYYGFSSTSGSETFDFDPGPNVVSFGDAFVAKYTADGDFLWARGVQGTTSTVKGKKGGGGSTTTSVSGKAAGVAADSSGNLYVMAEISGAGTVAGVDAGNVPYTTSVAVGSNSEPRLLIAKFDSNGNLLWRHEYANAAAKRQYWGGIAVHEVNGVTDGIFIGNSFTGTVDFDPSAAVAQLTSVGSADVYILKLDASGAYKWAVRGGAGGEDFVSAISVAPNGTVYATGGFNGQNPFGPSYPISSQGGQDGWVAKIDGANGQVGWARSFGGQGLDAGREVEAKNDYVAIAGNFDVGGSAIFGSHAFQSNGQLDAFASKLDANGNFLWTRSFGGTGNEHGWGLAVDSADNVYVGGNYYDSVDFDQGPGTYMLTSPGTNSDAFVVGLKGDGQFHWATQLTGPGSNYLRDITWNPFDNSILVGGGTYTSQSPDTQAANLAGPIGPLLSTPGAFVFELSAASGLLPGFEPNEPPVAVAGSPASGNEDEAVSLNASGSSDPENEALVYIWDFGDGRSTQSNSLTINHVYDHGGTFLITLTVQDGHGNQSVDSTSATIVEVNDVPVANVGNPYSGYENQPVHFNASASMDFDNNDGTSANDQVLKYHWNFGDGNTATTSIPTVDHVYALVGAYRVSLVVDDGLVNSLASETGVEIAIQPIDTSNSLYVYDIRFESRKGGKEWRAVFEIRRDSDGNSTLGDDVVAGATITVNFAGLDYTGMTDANGVFRTSWRSNLSKGTGYYANVVALSHSQYNWSLFDNVDDREDDSDGDGSPDDYLML